MSINAPFQTAPDRSCYIVYLGEDGNDAPTQMYGTRSEVKREALRRMSAAKEANGGSLRKKLARAIPIRRKGSVVSPDEAEAPVSAINLLDLPVEILDQIVRDIGTKNFYDDPGRLTVCKKWYAVARPTMLRHVMLDVNSLMRAIPSARLPVVRKLLLRRNSSSVGGGGGGGGDEQRTGLRPAEIVQLDADIRVINGFITKNNVPVARNSDYKRWKGEIDASLERLATHMHEMARVRDVRLRLWSRDCLISESRQREWWRLARSAVDHLCQAPTPALDSVELDFCGTAFTWMRCGWKENSSACAAIFALLPRVRVLRVRVQCLCPYALDGESSGGGAGGGAGGGGAGGGDNNNNDSDIHPASSLPRLPRLQQLIINRDTWEANPWSGSGPRAGICMRPRGLPGPGNQELVRAMRRVVQRMDNPRVVRFLWHDNTFEREFVENASLPVNGQGQVAYTGSVAYDLLNETVERLGFLAEWDAPGRLIPECPGHLWEKGSSDELPAAPIEQIL